MKKLYSLIVVMASLSGCVVYGVDDRQDVQKLYQSPSKVSKFAQNIDASFAIIEKKHLTKKGDEYLPISKKRLSQQVVLPYYYKNNGKWEAGIIGKPLCKGEKFSDQQVLSFCSGTLVDTDKIVTAGHCLKENPSVKGNARPISDVYIVFDYEQSLSGGVIKMSDVYEIASLPNRRHDDPHHRFNKPHDYAVALLKRKVTGRTPAQFRRQKKIGNRSEVYAIGHPDGLPKKITGHTPQGTVKVYDNKPPYIFTAGLDTFSGNSGGGVFNRRTHKLEGMLIRGATDYYYDSKNDCGRINVCRPSGKNECSVVKLVKGQSGWSFVKEKYEPGEAVYRITGVP